MKNSKNIVLMVLIAAIIDQQNMVCGNAKSKNSKSIGAKLKEKFSQSKKPSTPAKTNNEEDAFGNDAKGGHILPKKKLSPEEQQKLDQELWNAVNDNNDEKVLESLDEGADVNARDGFGRTPLFDAKTPETAESLINAGAKVDAVDYNHNTALMFACENGNEAVVQALIAAKANVNAVDYNGRTALLVASKNGNEAVVQALIAAGANVNAVDNNGRTALMFICENGNEAVVQALIAAKANVNAVDNNGRTALMFASKNGHEAVVKALIYAKKAKGLA